jgi:solute carrier family 25 oxoglutarate transporter 11
MKGLFAGLGAGIFRQLAYGTPRMALYTIGLGKLSDADVKPNMAQKMALGSVSGATAALGSVPADVVMVRMAADAKAPADQRRNYTGVGNALLRVYKEEGLAALWSGTAPTVRVYFVCVRACLNLPVFYSKVYIKKS